MSYYLPDFKRTLLAVNGHESGSLSSLSVLSLAVSRLQARGQEIPIFVMVETQEDEDFSEEAYVDFRG